MARRMRHFRRARIQVGNRARHGATRLLNQAPAAPRGTALDRFPSCVPFPNS